MKFGGEDIFKIIIELLFRTFIILDCLYPTACYTSYGVGEYERYEGDHGYWSLFSPSLTLDSDK